MFNKLKKFLKSKKAIGSIETAIKVVTACVLGAAILVGGFALIKDTVLPSMTTKTQEIADYNGGSTGGSTSVVAPVTPTSSVTNLVTSYEDNKRFSTSGALKDAAGLVVVTNYIARTSATDVFRIKINGATESDLTEMLSNTQLYTFEYYSADGENFTMKQYQQALGGSTAWTVETDTAGDPILVGYSNATKTHVPWVYGVDTSTTQGWNYFRIGLVGSGADVIITVNEEI